MLVLAMVEVRMVAATLVLTPRLVLPRMPLGMSLLAWKMGSWRVLRRSSHRKVASLVHVYSSDARLISPRGICLSTSHALASSTNDSRCAPVFCFPYAHNNAVYGAHGACWTLHEGSHHAC